MSFDKYEPSRTEELGDPIEQTADVQNFGDHQQPGASLEKKENPNKETKSISELPKSLTTEVQSSIQKGTTEDRKQALAMIPKEKDIWPPVTIEASVGGTEGGKNVETKNA